MSKTLQRTDVFVAGGGPAGLAAAIALRMVGFSVVLAERHRPPIDKACGEGLMPDGVALLERMGVVFPFGTSLPFAGVRFIEKGVVATGRFRRGTGLGVRRTVLHQSMLRRAEELGVECLWGREVVDVRRDGVELHDRVVSARWVVGADGKNSRIRRSLRLDVPPVQQRVGIRRHYEVQPWSDLVEVYWSTGCEAYVTPVGKAQVCLAMLVDDPTLRFDQALGRFSALSQRLGAAPQSSREQTDVTVVRRCPQVVSGRVALVGEASGSVDAITGDGITVALHQAMALARSLQRSDLQAYSRAHRRLMRLPDRMGSLLLAIDRRPRLRRWVLRGLAGAPPVFSHLLALHTRSLPLVHPAAWSSSPG